MSRLANLMDAKLYPGVSPNWDDELFREWILEHLHADHSVLDYGAGRGNVVQMNFRGIARRVAGVDPAEEVLKNPFLDESKILDLTTNRIPFEDATFDLVISDNVMEHVQNPEAVLQEICRVLKPGGVFLGKTPNACHYMPLVARSTPTWFHRWFNRYRGRDTVDTFPTAYRLNSRRSVARHAESAGLLVRKVRFFESRPEYLRFSAVTYLFGYIYERIVNAIGALSRFRCVMIVKLEKPQERKERFQ